MIRGQFPVRTFFNREVQYDLESKIQTLVSGLDNPGLSQRDPISSFDVSLNHVLRTHKKESPKCIHGSRLIHFLVNHALNKNDPAPLKNRCVRALLAMEEIYPRLETINRAFKTLPWHSSKLASSIWKIVKQSPVLPYPMIPFRPNFPIPYSVRLLFPLSANRHNFPARNDQKPCSIVFGQKVPLVIMHGIDQICEREKTPRPWELPVAEWLRDPLWVQDGVFFVPIPVMCGQVFIMMQGLLDLKYPYQAMNNIDPTSALLCNELRVQRVPFYFEGGNLLRASNKAGEPFLISGSNHVLLSVMNGYYFFQTFEQQKALLDEISRLKNSNSISEERLELIENRLANAGLVSAWYTKDEKRFLSYLMLAGSNCILQRMEKTFGRRVLMIGDLFDSQPEFHIDLCVLPSADGVVFLQNHDLSLRLLNCIERSYQLTEPEKERLNLYRKYGEIKKQLEDGKYRLIQEQLQQAGFDVVETPGVFFKEPIDPNFPCSYAVNFLNSLLMTGGNGQPFFVSNGSSHPFDRYLRDAFSLLLERRDYRVYFIGRELTADPRQGYENLFSYAHSDNELGLDGGIHCMTQEIAVEDLKIARQKEAQQIEPPAESPIPIADTAGIFFRKMVAFEKENKGK